MKTDSAFLHGRGAKFQIPSSSGQGSNGHGLIRLGASTLMLAPGPSGLRAAASAPRRKPRRSDDRLIALLSLHLRVAGRKNEARMRRHSSGLIQEEGIGYHNADNRRSNREQRTPHFTAKERACKVVSVTKLQLLHAERTVLPFSFTVLNLFPQQPPQDTEVTHKLDQNTMPSITTSTSQHRPETLSAPSAPPASRLHFETIQTISNANSITFHLPFDQSWTRGTKRTRGRRCCIEPGNKATNDRGKKLAKRGAGKRWAQPGRHGWRP